MIRHLPITVIAAAGVSAAALAPYGCGQNQARAQQAALDPYPMNPRVWIDPRTGCEYLISQYGVSARFHQNGLPICLGKEK